ncbi:MAG: hypothetical protein IJP67_05300, partial [Oscillospiraceae bacterium]|nr:hypothetical protein [Oscillospiraceae bacterium]
MASSNSLPFLEMFPFCEALSDLASGEVTGCTVMRETRSIEIKANFKKFIPPAYLNQAEEMIRRRVSSVKLLRSAASQPAGLAVPAMFTQQGMPSS